MDVRNLRTLVYADDSIENTLLFPQESRYCTRGLTSDELSTLKHEAQKRLEENPDFKTCSPSVWAHWFCIVNSVEYVNNIRILVRGANCSS